MTELLKEYKTKLTAIRHFESMKDPESLVICTIQDLKERVTELETELARGL